MRALFGVLAVEMAVSNPATTHVLGLILFLVALVFVYRSFYGMRITSAGPKTADKAPVAASEASA